LHVPTESYIGADSSSGGLSVKDVISQLKLHDAYDLLAAMKAYIDGEHVNSISGSKIYVDSVTYVFCVFRGSRGARESVIQRVPTADHGILGIHARIKI
jgi:hypothetical protein